MSRRDQAHQRVLQTRRTTSITAAYKLLQKGTRALKSDRRERRAVELQRAADRNNMNGFYNGVKEMWGAKKNGPVHLKSTDGMETISDSKTVVARWSEHIQKLLNVPRDIETKLWTTSRSALPRQASMRFQPWLRWLEQ